MHHGRHRGDGVRLIRTWESGGAMASISKYFSLEDLSWSDTAARNRIDNMPKDQAVIDALTALASSVLDPIRAHYGVALRPNSGFRCRALEEAIYYKQVARMRARGGKLEVDKWFEKKQHPRGLAADIEVGFTAARNPPQWRVFCFWRGGGNSGLPDIQIVAGYQRRS